MFGAAMNRELRSAFNKEIHKYRGILSYYAKRCEWDSFKVYAGRLFDYVEAVEMSEIRRRFMSVFRLMLVAVFFVTLFVLMMRPETLPAYVETRKFFAMTALGGGSFSLYFFLNFRLYIDYKTVNYKKRKERFIRIIELDFRNDFLPANA